MSILDSIIKNIQHHEAELDKITKYHEAELDKLRTARDVVARLQNVPIKAAQSEGVAADDSGLQPKFVVTRTKPKVEPVKTRKNRKDLRQRIINLMTDCHARPSSIVTAQLNIRAKDEMEATWRLLTKLKTAGVLVYENGNYFMPSDVAELEKA